MARSDRYVVVRAQNDHDAMTVRDADRNGTYHVVECDGEELETLLDAVEPGDVVRLALRRVGRRGNAWCAEEAEPAGGERGDSVLNGEETDRVAEGEEADPAVGC
ncbi:hypothetical protein ACFPM1_07385 [Halorubrum rubrum]|uniref:DUF7999 domain-containing protein n=1 Tax=Halorubrum rubrum TaxID=1126240 RepID=A0ABD5R0Q5_9EURY|nr:hypothetical protein [Halorubrum rubrum]